MFQEVVFYEDGEPIIDGEPGDLKVRLLTDTELHFVTVVFVLIEL